MILLETANVIIRDTLNEKIQKPTTTDLSFVDYDSVRYSFLTPPSAPKTLLHLSIALPCFSQLLSYGVLPLLTREYGPSLLPTEQAQPGYNLTLAIDLAALAEIADHAERNALVEKFALLKRFCLAAPFERAFERARALEGEERAGRERVPGEEEQVMIVQYRPEEAFYVRPSSDRVTVIFSTTFAEEQDRIFGKVFLQEFVDARRRPSIQTAPQVLYANRDAPAEIKNLPGVAEQVQRFKSRNAAEDELNFVTFVLFPRHYDRPDKSFDTISSIQLFRDYLHYHIKCSKAYMHSRMRSRVADFLKILNRAKPEIGEKERRTAQGRTFRAA